MGKFASGKHALGICDRCGQSFKLNSLREETINSKRAGNRVCRSCFDPDHPQYKVGQINMDDPQALRDARPDGPPADYRDIDW